jgi:hypothetical protein
MAEASTHQKPSGLPAKQLLFPGLSVSLYLMNAWISWAHCIQLGGWGAEPLSCLTAGHSPGGSLPYRTTAFWLALCALSWHLWPQRVTRAQLSSPPPPVAIHAPWLQLKGPSEVPVPLRLLNVRRGEGTGLRLVSVACCCSLFILVLDSMPRLDCCPAGRS